MEREYCIMSKVNESSISRRSLFQVAAGAAVAAAAAGVAIETAAPEQALAAGKKKKEVKIAASDDPSYVIDATGKQVMVPENIERVVITCQGGTTHEAVIFGGADKIVAEPSMKRFPQLLRMFPELNDVTDGGSFDDINIETIAATAPDIALCGVSSDKGNAQIEEIGIPVYVMLIGWAGVESLKQEFLNVSHLFGNDERGQELVDYWDEKLGLIAERVAALPEEERAKTVYYISKPDITKANTGDWGRNWLDACGVTFAVPEEDLNGDITAEKAIGWDPDYIVIQGGNGDVSELLNEPTVQDMKAIQSGEVHICPIGGFWWDRPSAEAPLAFLWLAQITHPGYFDDIDLEQETVDFFKRFYNYDLPQEEYESFFA